MVDRNGGRDGEEQKKSGKTRGKMAAPGTWDCLDQGEKGYICGATIGDNGEDDVGAKKIEKTGGELQKGKVYGVLLIVTDHIRKPEMAAGGAISRRPPTPRKIRKEALRARRVKRQNLRTEGKKFQQILLQCEGDLADHVGEFSRWWQGEESERGQGKRGGREGRTPDGRKGGKTQAGKEKGSGLNQKKTAVPKLGDDHYTRQNYPWGVRKTTSHAGRKRSVELAVSRI